MTKTYLFKYDEDNFILMDNQPEKEENKFLINVDTMEFDTTLFYELVFKDVTERINIQIINQLDEHELDKNLYKKGMRVYQTISDLCEKICMGINQECFSTNIDA